MPREQKIQAVGLVWYRAETYEQVRKIMADAHTLPETYAEWLVGADRREEQTSKQGVLVIRAHIDEAEFTEFCRAKGLTFNSQARGQYAAFKAWQAIQAKTGGNA